MATEAELVAETWWGREVITPELRTLCQEICRRTNRPLVAAGTKGDRFHLNGAHRSQEWLRNSRFCTSRTYTVQMGISREQARHVAGFDFTPGSGRAMIAQSTRLLAAMKAGRLEEVREFYGNIDGNRTVDGWNNLRDRPASADDTHLWHWHLSIDRRKLRDGALMERILATALGDAPTAEGGIMLPQEGDRGEVVKYWQRVLNAVDDAGLDIDGRYGKQTARAVHKFWKKKGGASETFEGEEITGWTAYQLHRAWYIKIAQTAAQPPG
jgi:hypothetical protein